MNYLFFTILLTMPWQLSYAASAYDFNLKIEPKWHNLELNAAQSQQFGGKWVLVGSITFQKKSDMAVNLTKLNLRWKGQPINTLFGSLYRKNLDKEFRPVEENLVCDGEWNKSKQTLNLTFDQKETLGLENVYYLVLTIPEQLEPIVKLGSFEIIEHTLPQPFRLAISKQQLSLALDAVDSSTTEIP